MVESTSPRRTSAEPSRPRPSINFVERRRAELARVNWASVASRSRVDNEAVLVGDSADADGAEPRLSGADSEGEDMLDELSSVSLSSVSSNGEASASTFSLSAFSHEFVEQVPHLTSSRLREDGEDDADADAPPRFARTALARRMSMQPTDLASSSNAKMTIVHTRPDGTKMDLVFAGASVPNVAVHAFNKDPKRTVQGLRCEDSELCLEHGRAFTYGEIATWLLTCGRLSKNKLGDFLGAADAEAVAVLDALVLCLEPHFSLFTLDEALRFFLSIFRLPGEAQQIGRVMERFASGYASARPTLFVNADTAYVLCYALILLNVDAHSEQVTNKMTLEQFISNNRGIDDGRDLPRDLLASLYVSIVRDEIKIEQREYISAVTEGWLYKQGGRVKTFKKRYVILSGSVIYYYKTAKEREPLGFIPLEDVEVRSMPDLASFKLIPAGTATVMKSVHAKKGGRTSAFAPGHHRSFLFRAATSAEMRHWVDAICAHSVETTSPMKRRALSESSGGRRALSESSGGRKPHPDTPPKQC